MAPARCLKMLRPEVGPPTKSSPRRPHLWEPRPAANGASSVPEKASARGRASHKKQRCTPLTLWEPRPRGEWRQPGARKSFGPRSDLPLKAVHATLICGRRALAANGASSVPEKASPRGRASHKKQCTPPSFVGGATRGEWRRLGARKASPRGRASHKKQCTLPSFVGAATRGERRQLGARKSFALGRASHKKAVHTAPHWEARPLACRLLRRTHDFFAPSRFPAMRACRRSCPYASFQHTRNA